METGGHIAVSLWTEKALHDRIIILYVAERTLRRKSKMVDLLIAFGIGTVLGAFGVLLWASCAIKKQKKQRNDDI